jgi:TonB family protein
LSTQNDSMRIFSILLPLFVTVVFWGCSGSKNISNSDLNKLDVEVEQIDLGTPYYLLTVSGFKSKESWQYSATLDLLNRYFPDDVLLIHEEFDKIQEDKPQLKAEIKDHPLSLNRVLWLMGPEHFRNHYTEYSPPLTKDTPLKKMPELIGGISAIQKELKYPRELRQANVTGRVFVNFIVNEFGEVEDPNIAVSLHVLADMEAIRVVRKAKFTPGEVEGVPVRVRYSLPIHFRPPR